MSAHSFIEIFKQEVELLLSLNQPISPTMDVFKQEVESFGKACREGPKKCPKSG